LIVALLWGAFCCADVTFNIYTTGDLTSTTATNWGETVYIYIELTTDGGDEVGGVVREEVKGGELLWQAIFRL